MLIPRPFLIIPTLSLESTDSFDTILICDDNTRRDMDAGLTRWLLRVMVEARNAVRSMIIFDLGSVIKYLLKEVVEDLGRAL